MRLVVNNELNKIYNDYISNNFKEIIIKGNNNKYSINLIEKSKENIVDNNEEISNISTYSLINLIVNNFINRNNIIACQKSLYNYKNFILLENDINQKIMIYSCNLNKNFPLINKMFDNINIINDNTYDLIDNNLIDRIEIHYSNLINSSSKCVIKRDGLIKIIITNSFDDEFINLIDHYKTINGSYNSTTIINFKDFKHKELISFDNNKEIIIYGKDMINYIERGKVYGKVNNGKISKFM